LAKQFFSASEGDLLGQNRAVSAEALPVVAVSARQQQSSTECICGWHVLSTGGCCLES